MSNTESVLPITHFGLEALEQTVDRETFIYIVRSLYTLVFDSKKNSDNKQQLRQRIQAFEKESRLPRILSTIPIDQLLIELEDIQYVYPIRRREISLPTFH